MPPKHSPALSVSASQLESVPVMGSKREWKSLMWRMFSVNSACAAPANPANMVSAVAPRSSFFIPVFPS